MKIGPEFEGTAPKRAIDLTVAIPGMVIYRRNMRALRDSLETPPSDMRFQQPRVGQLRSDGSRLFMINKIITLGEDGQPLNELARQYRCDGRDEAGQALNILLGNMAACGPRPMVKNPMAGAMSYVEIMDLAPVDEKDAWFKMTQRRKPGLFSSWAEYEHTQAPGNRADMVAVRVGLDLKDDAEDSIRTNLRFIQRFAQLSLSGELERPSTTVAA